MSKEDADRLFNKAEDGFIPKITVQDDTHEQFVQPNTPFKKLKDYIKSNFNDQKVFIYKLEKVELSDMVVVSLCDSSTMRTNMLFTLEITDIKDANFIIKNMINDIDSSITAINADNINGVKAVLIGPTARKCM